MGRFTAVGALLCVVASTPVLAECTAADRAALQAFDAAWTKASSTGDRAALTTMLSDNFGNMSIVGGGSKAGNIENSVRNAALNGANPQPASTQDRFAFICAPSVATIMHRNTVPAVSPALYPTYSRTMHVLEKKGNSWQVITSVGNLLTDQQTLLYMEQDWNDADQNHDASWYERNFAPNATNISSRTGAMENKAQSVESAKTDKTVYESLELSEVNVRVNGDAAVVTGVNHVKGKDGVGKAFDRKLRYTDTYIKRDGQWQVWATQGTTIQ